MLPVSKTGKEGVRSSHNPTWPKCVPPASKFTLRVNLNQQKKDNINIKTNKIFIKRQLENVGSFGCYI